MPDEHNVYTRNFVVHCKCGFMMPGKSNRDVRLIKKAHLSTAAFIERKSNGNGGANGDKGVGPQRGWLS